MLYMQLRDGHKGGSWATSHVGASGCSARGRIVSTEARVLSLNVE